jgi:putative hemolysin
MEIVIILALVILNGIFSMSEAAIIASRKARLQQTVDKDAGAKTALELAEEPNRFLSTVQIGITLIGVLTGAFGGATLAAPIAEALKGTFLEPYAEAIGFGIIVLITTYLSLILGELVPKRIALQNPERIASLVARPMKLLSRIASPLVTFLGASTDAVLWAIGMRQSSDPPVTEEEIKAMIQQGIAAGVFEESEHDMVEGIFRLGDRRINTLMTPRTEILWLDIEDEPAVNRQKIIESPFSRLPVGEDGLDNVIGMLNAKDLLAKILKGEDFDILKAMTEPLFVPESMSASKVLDLFRETGTHITLVLDEYGGLEGLVTIQDILEQIVGDIEEEEVVQRKDGSYLLDGMMGVDDFKELFDLEALPGEHDSFETLAGFILLKIGSIPRQGDSMQWNNLDFEIIDMDGNRVDKVLVKVVAPEDDPDSDTNSGSPAIGR